MKQNYFPDDILFIICEYASSVNSLKLVCKQFYNIIRHKIPAHLKICNEEDYVWITHGDHTNYDDELQNKIDNIKMYTPDFDFEINKLLLQNNINSLTLVYFDELPSLEYGNNIEHITLIHCTIPKSPYSDRFPYLKTIKMINNRTHFDDRNYNSINIFHYLTSININHSSSWVNICSLQFLKHIEIKSTNPIGLGDNPSLETIDASSYSDDKCAVYFVYTPLNNVHTLCIDRIHIYPKNFGNILNIQNLTLKNMKWNDINLCKLYKLEYLYIENCHNIYGIDNLENLKSITLVDPEVLIGNGFLSKIDKLEHLSLLKKKTDTEYRGMNSYLYVHINNLKSLTLDLGIKYGIVDSFGIKNLTIIRTIKESNFGKNHMIFPDVENLEIVNKIMDDDLLEIDLNMFSSLRNVKLKGDIVAHHKNLLDITIN